MLEYTSVAQLNWKLSCEIKLLVSEKIAFHTSIELLEFKPQLHSSLTLRP